LQQEDISYGIYLSKSQESWLAIDKVIAVIRGLTFLVYRVHSLCAVYLYVSAAGMDRDRFGANAVSLVSVRSRFVLLHFMYI